MLSAGSRIGRRAGLVAAQLASYTSSLYATSNLAFFVATTGSDLNPGTQAQPFLTITKALATAAQYDYQNTYTLTITVAAGTYAAGITLPFLKNYPSNGYYTYGAFLTGVPGAKTTCVISSTTVDAVATAPFAVWQLNGFQLKSTAVTYSDLNCVAWSEVAITNIDFAGSQQLCTAEIFSYVQMFTGCSCSTSACITVLNAFFYSAIINDGAVFTITNAVTVSNYFASIGDKSILGSGTYTNAGNVTGPKFNAYSHSHIEFAGARSTFPGTTTSVLTNFSMFAGDAGVALTDYSGTLRGDYNISNAGQWSWTGDFYLAGATTGGTFIEWYNSSAGGHDQALFGMGSAGGMGLTAGQGGFIDYSNSKMNFWWDTSANFTFVGAVRWSSVGSATAVAADVGFSRLAAGSLALDTSTIGNKGGMLTLAALCPSPPPTTGKTGAYTWDSGSVLDTSIIFNGSGSITTTLPAAATYPGRILIMKTLTAFTVISATSNVRPKTSQTAGTAILPATAGAFVILHSDGTDWVIMAGT